MKEEVVHLSVVRINWEPYVLVLCKKSPVHPDKTTGNEQKVNCPDCIQKLNTIKNEGRSN